MQPKNDSDVIIGHASLGRSFYPHSDFGIPIWRIKERGDEGAWS